MSKYIKTFVILFHEALNTLHLEIPQNSFLLRFQTHLSIIQLKMHMVEYFVSKIRLHIY